MEIRQNHPRLKQKYLSSDRDDGDLIDDFLGKSTSSDFVILVDRVLVKVAYRFFL